MADLKTGAAGSFSKLHDLAKKHEAKKLESRYTNSDLNNSVKVTEVLDLPIDSIIPDPNQPRKRFNPTSIEELTKSIAERGVEQPITVRKYTDTSNPDIQYMIVMGERRWRACKSLGLKTIPAIVKNIDAVDAYISALTENIQREDLHYLDEAAAFQEMLDRKIVSTQAEIASKLGIPKTRVSEKLKILSLPESVKKLILETQNISFTNAVLLARVPDEKFCLELAKKVNDGLISREKLSDMVVKGKKPERKEKSSFRAVQINQTRNGFNLYVKYRIDRPEDKRIIIETLRQKIEELEMS